MPCYDGREDEDNARNYKLVAALCGIMRVLENRVGYGDPLVHVNWKEVGVTREFVEKWWKEHKRQDADRRRREKEYAEQRRRAELQQLALLEKKYRGTRSGKL